MSTNPVTAPPAAPPNQGGAGGGGGGGEPIGIVQVTRNVPPKRVVVNANNTVMWGGKVYNPGDTLLLPGPEADGLAFQGHVIITSHEEVDAWNGKEGEEQRRAALAHVDAIHAEQGTERTHDHGFRKYEHADGKNARQADYTSDRQQLARDHMYDPGKPDVMTNEQAGISGPSKGEE